MDVNKDTADTEDAITGSDIDSHWTRLEAEDYRDWRRRIERPEVVEDCTLGNMSVYHGDEDSDCYIYVEGDAVWREDAGREIDIE